MGEFNTTTSNIFLDYDKLKTEFVPSTRNDIISREKECQDLINLLSPILKSRIPYNALLYGKTGTGKSLLTKFFTHQLVEEAKIEGINVCRVYINCSEHDTTCRVITEIANNITGKQKIPVTGLPKSEYYGRFWDVLNGFDGFIIVILDEVDKMKEAEILYSIPRAVENENIDKQTISVICNTNNLTFKNRLDPRIKSSLSCTEYLFTPYDANQLRAILYNRAESTFLDGVLAPETIPLCAALAAFEHGDARRAINLLRVSGEIADLEHAKTITEAHVRKAHYRVESDQIQEAINTLPRQSGIILSSIIHLVEDGANNITATSVYKRYQEICSQCGYISLTSRRVNDLLSELDMLGIIHTKVLSKGRYGRAMELEIGVPIEQIRAAISHGDKQLGQNTLSLWA